MLDEIWMEVDSGSTGIVPRMAVGSRAILLYVQFPVLFIEYAWK